MAIAFPYQAPAPAQATSFGPQAPIPQPQPGPQAQVDPMVELRMAQEKAAALPPEARPQVAAQLFTTNGPAPQAPTTGQQGLGLQGEGATQPAPDDGVGGWLHFLNQLADPEGPSRFLLETSANILSPRPEQVSGASHVASGLADSVGRLGQRRTAQAQARSQRELEAAKIGELEARSDLYGAQGDSTRINDMKIPSEIVLNYARAYNQRQSGKSTAMPAAKVQQLGVIAEAILNTAPDVYTPQTALLAAQEFINPDMTRSTFLKDFGALYAIMGGTEDISNQANTLADSMGLKGNLTLGDIEAQQAEATRPTPTEAEITAANTTREGAMAYAMKYLGKSEEEARALVEQKYGAAPAGDGTAPAPEVEEAPAVEAPTGRGPVPDTSEARELNKAERKAEVTSGLRNLKNMTPAEVKVWYDEHRSELKGVQLDKVMRAMGAKRVRGAWKIPSDL